MALGQSVAECASTTHLTLRVEDRAGTYYCFNCIIEGVQTQGYNLALRVMQDRQLAEDALQEAFLSAYRRFGQFRGDSLQSWLLRIVANAAKDMLRSGRARPAFSLDAMVLDPLDPDSPPVEFVSGEESPDDYALRREVGAAVQEGLARLSDDQKLAVTLVDIQGMSYEEASQILGCSLGTIKSRISRGRAGLRDFLRTQGELLPERLRLDV